MKQKITLTGWLLLAGAFMTGNLRAAEIRGTVRDARTGYFLEDVEVSVNAGKANLLTDREGHFEATGLPEGEHRLTFTYPGMSTHSELVSLTGAESSKTLNIALTSPETNEQVVMLEKFTVAGVKEGQAASMARQKAADNVQVIISMDAHGDVADGNIGNFLQRLAGVTVTKDAGDITNITLRGSPAGASAISMDGRQLPTDDNRSVRVDYIPSEFIKEIEVIKGATPDMWADGLTGTVNLITKSAFDYKNAVFNYSSGVSANTYRSDLWEWGPFATFTGMDVVANRKLGISVSASYNKSARPRDWVQVARRSADDGRVTQARLLDDVVYRERSGTNLKLEYRPDRTLGIRFNAGWNRYKQWSDRNNFDISPTNGTANINVADYTVVDRAQIEAGSTPRTEGNLMTAGVAPGFTDTYTEILHAVVNNQAAIGIGTTDVYRYSLELVKKPGNGMRMDFSLNTTRRQDDSSWITLSSIRRGKVGVGVDTSGDPKRPVFTQTYGPNIGFGADYAGTEGRLDISPTRAVATVNTLTANLSKDAHWVVPVRLKAGVGARLQDRDAVTGAYRWIYSGNMNHYLKGSRAYSLFDGQYFGNDQLDIHQALREFSDPATQSGFTNASGYANTPPPASEITEDVFIGYVMAAFTWRQLMVTGGVRNEWTNIHATGPYSDPRWPEQNVITKKSDYSQPFPSLHLKYTLRRNLVARASYSTTMSRPPIARLVPQITISSYEDEGDEDSVRGTISMNNVNLRPQYGKNWDVALEYYLMPSGIISVGWFRKDITDFISSITYIAPPGDEYEGYRITSLTNVGSAQIEGYELEYNQQLSFLPKPFNGISLFCNYTHIKTQGNYNDGLDELVNFVPRTFNAGLTWRWWKLEGRVQYRYQSGKLLQYSTDPTLKNRETADDTMDINVRYNFRPWLTFYCDLQNVLNENPYWYNISRDRIIKSETTGMQLTLGVSGRF